MIFKFLLILILFFSFFKNAQSKKIIQGIPKIIDGDTVHIGKYKIRLHGIDAPESKQNCHIINESWDCGYQSTIALKNLVSKKEIFCEIIDIDKYKRYIGICFINNQNINKFMVLNGWAIAYRYYSKDYINEEKVAKDKKVGIWKGDFEEPYLFRKKEKNKNN